MELTEHLENHRLNKKNSVTSPPDRLAPVRRHDLTCECKNIIRGYSNLQSSWCVLKIELLITVQYKSRMTNTTIISAASLVDSIPAVCLCHTHTKLSDDEIPATWPVRCRNTRQTLLFRSRYNLEGWEQSKVFPAINHHLSKGMGGSSYSSAYFRFEYWEFRVRQFLGVLVKMYSLRPR